MNGSGTNDAGPSVPQPGPGEDPAVGEVAEFLAVMRRLRAECPWKREQTHRSLARYLVEETYETVDAIDEGERTGDHSHLAEELGDVLLQVVFHAVIAEERDDFDLADVARGITAKMRRRNPHVFGVPSPAGATESTAEATTPLDARAVDELWQQAKASERAAGPASEQTDPLSGLPSALPALLYADKALGRLERAGRPLRPAGEPAADPAVRIGEELLSLVGQARVAGVDPEQALRAAVRARL